MPLVTAKDFPGIFAQKDKSGLARGLQQALTGHRQQQETQRLEQIQVAKNKIEQFGFQAQTALGMDNIDRKKKFLAQMGQRIQREGGDLSEVNRLMAIEKVDDLNLALTQIATAAADGGKRLDEALKQAGAPSKQFAASAKSEFLEGGGTRKILPDGREEIMNRFGQVVTGQDAVDVLERSAKIVADKEEASQDLRVETERDLQQVKNAEATSNKAFDAIDKLRLNISNLEQVTPLIGEGANTGPISRLFPSVKAATIKLEQLQKRLALDVVGSTTFGALSKGELDLARAVAIPLALEGDPLIQWANNAIDAKRKLASYLEDQAVFLSNGGTQTEWLEKKTAELEGLLIRAGATEDDIKQTMKDNGMTRSQVLEELRRRFPDGS